jgi:hypothetical protein
MGSYGFVRGISLFVGGFPNIEVSLFYDNEVEDLEIDERFYYYVAGIVVVFALGAYW